MSHYLSIEELVLDDSFNNYCLQSNKDDVLFWNGFIKAHPEEHATIEEAKSMVLGLRLALSGLYDEDTKEKEHIQPANSRIHKSFPVKKMVWWTAAVAAVFLIIIGFTFLGVGGIELSGKRKEAATRQPVQPLLYMAAKGEKKVIRLSDSTTIHLNAGSSLRLEDGFGTTNRTVYLSGEALFDVTHRSDQPFMVRLHNYDVKVLGTLFNVRAYPGEKVSETSLIRGRVQILKKDGGDLTLVPNQKVLFKEIRHPKIPVAREMEQGQPLTTQRIVPLFISPNDGCIVETAWAQNRLVIVNESFHSLKNKLERWYNVQIALTDKEVSEYRFTATFERENITEVLEALRFAYPFTYEVKDGIIRISK